jgi:ABC-type nickel/cobalt efflux system permease component RcnA
MGALVNPAALLVCAVIAVGVLHTAVPDHWAPIALLARQQGWNRSQVARAALGAGLGHALSTLVIGALVWVVGAIAARRLGNAVSIASSIALIGFGGWVAVSAWRELRTGHDHEHFGHSHLHRHADGSEHRHWHEHHDADWHQTSGSLALASPMHEHEHKTSPRLALMLVLGSSPMLEGIPAFFAASRYGIGLLSVMALLFALSTIATYIVLCVGSVTGAARVDFGPLERYGEVLSGGIIVVLGVLFLFI